MDAEHKAHLQRILENRRRGGRLKHPGDKQSPAAPPGASQPSQSAEAIPPAHAPLPLAGALSPAAQTGRGGPGGSWGAAPAAGEFAAGAGGGDSIKGHLVASAADGQAAADPAQPQFNPPEGTAAGDIAPADGAATAAGSAPGHAGLSMSPVAVDSQPRSSEAPQPVATSLMGASPAPLAPASGPSTAGGFTATSRPQTFTAPPLLPVATTGAGIAAVAAPPGRTATGYAPALSSYAPRPISPAAAPLASVRAGLGLSPGPSRHATPFHGTAIVGSSRAAAAGLVSLPPSAGSSPLRLAYSNGRGGGRALSPGGTPLASAGLVPPGAAGGRGRSTSVADVRSRMAELDRRGGNVSPAGRRARSNSLGATIGGGGGGPMMLTYRGLGNSSGGGGGYSSGGGGGYSSGAAASALGGVRGGNGGGGGFYTSPRRMAPVGGGVGGGGSRYIGAGLSNLNGGAADSGAASMRQPAARGRASARRASTSPQGRRVSAGGRGDSMRRVGSMASRWHEQDLEQEAAAAASFGRPAASFYGPGAASGSFSAPGHPAGRSPSAGNVIGGGASSGAAVAGMPVQSRAVRGAMALLQAGDWWHKWDRTGQTVKPIFAWVEHARLVWGKEPGRPSALFSTFVPLERITDISATEIVDHGDYGARVFHVLVVHTAGRDLRFGSERRAKLDQWFAALREVLQFYRVNGAAAPRAMDAVGGGD